MSSSNHSEQTEQVGGVILVPPNESKVGRKSRRFCLTLNNWTEDEYRNIKSSFEAKAKNWIIGKEVGDEGTPHLQIYVDFKSPREFKTVKNMTSTRVHIEGAKGSVQCNWKYCIKDGDFETNIDADQWISTHERARMLCMEEYKNVVWRPFQQEIISLLEEEPSKRNIYWYHDAKGASGKSFLVKHIALNNEGVILGCGKTADVFNQINDMMNPEKGPGTIPRIIILDLPRSSLEFLNYGCIEQIKNGCLFSGKYKGGCCIFPHPHVIIFANDEPKRGQLSRDRLITSDITEE